MFKIYKQIKDIWSKTFSETINLEILFVYSNNSLFEKKHFSVILLLTNVTKFLQQKESFPCSNSNNNNYFKFLFISRTNYNIALFLKNWASKLFLFIISVSKISTASYKFRLLYFFVNGYYVNKIISFIIVSFTNRF